MNVILAEGISKTYGEKVLFQKPNIRVGKGSESGACCQKWQRKKYAAEHPCQKRRF